MSISISTPTSPGPMTLGQAIAQASGKGTLLANMAVAAQTDAKAIPTLVNELTALDPTLVAPVQAKGLVFSKTPIGIALAYGISWAAAKYGLGWDNNTVTLVVGAVVLAASYVMRYVTNSPIGGFFTAKKAT